MTVTIQPEFDFPIPDKIANEPQARIIYRIVVLRGPIKPLDVADLAGDSVDAQSATDMLDGLMMRGVVTRASNGYKGVVLDMDTTLYVRG